MKICSHCGRQIDGNVTHCPYCGSAIDYQTQEQYTYQPLNNNQAYHQPMDPRLINAKNFISTTKILGILAIIFIFIPALQLVSLICAIIGISKGNDAISEANLIGDPFIINEARKAKNVNIAALIIMLVLLALSIVSLIIMTILGIGLFGAGMSDFL